MTTLELAPPGFERLRRDDFLSELLAAFTPGQHLSAIGPTGRGKSTILGELVAGTRQFHTVVIMTPKGPDPAFLQLGTPTAVWPPRRSFGQTFTALFNPQPERDERGPKVWRVERPIRANTDWLELAGTYRKVLSAVPRRAEQEANALLVVVDESRFVCDPQLMNLGVEVRNTLILGRSKNASIINSFQAPRWVPREAMDQITHALIWQNRDKDVARRLAEISGAIDPRQFLATMQGLAFHEFLWIDATTNRLAIVDAK